MAKRSCQACIHYRAEQSQPGWGKCEKMETFRGAAEAADTQAYATDDEAYHATVSVRADFFCAMFERTTAAPKEPDHAR